MVDEAFIKHLEETVTILSPLKSSVPRGAASSNKNLQTVSIRLPQIYRDAIDEVTELIGIPRSEFMRWCAYYVALDILHQKKQYDRKQR